MVALGADLLGRSVSAQDADRCSLHAPQVTCTLHDQQWCLPVHDALQDGSKGRDSNPRPNEDRMLRLKDVSTGGSIWTINIELPVGEGRGGKGSGGEGRGGEVTGGEGREGERRGGEGRGGDGRGGEGRGGEGREGSGGEGR